MRPRHMGPALRARLQRLESRMAALEARVDAAIASGIEESAELEGRLEPAFRKLELLSARLRASDSAHNYLTGCSRSARPGPSGPH